MQFNEEKAIFKSGGNYSALHTYGFYTVGMEFFPQLFPVSGAGAHDMQSHSIVPSSMVQSRSTESTGHIAG